MLLKVKQLERFGLSYYGVYTTIAGNDVRLTEFLSLGLAHAYCARLQRAAGVPQAKEI